MCKKDTDGGSYCCCKCCTPTVSSIVVAIVGAAILVASFVIAAVVLTMLQDGIVKTARYNSPRSDSKAFNDWLSNIPSKRSTNDAALKYYQYYFFNITNLDAVIANGLSNTPSLVYPTVEEIGPYTYRYFVDRLDPTFDADDERLTYKEYYRYIFDASLSKMGSRNLDDQTDVFTTISLVYSSMFGNPFQETGRMPTASGLFGSPEIGFRFVTGFQLWAPYLQWLDTVGRTSVNGSLFNPLEFASPSSAIPLPACIANPLSVSCYQSIFAVQTVMTNVFTPNMKAKYPLGSASAFVDFGNQLLPAGQNKWSDAIPIEYWAYVATTTNNPLWYITSPTVMTKLLNSTLLNIGGCQFALGAANSAGCWANADVTTLNAAVAPRVGLSSDQVDGLKAYAKYVINDYWNWLMKSNGHLGHLYGSQVRAADAACAANQPTASYLSYTYTGTGGCVTFNNANMYVQATPRSLLFEQYNTLGAFLFATSTRTFNRRGNLSFSTNYTSELDSRQDSWQYTVGTGINHINDIDNLYLWKNKTQINTDLTGTWCHKSSDPTYAPSGIYPMQHFTIIPGYTYFQANQAQMTKYTPSYPPGKVSDSNRYSFEKSLISDKSFALDLFVGDISRHAKMVFYRDASIKGIDIQRYTIDESEFNSGLLFFGQYFYGLANYSCPAAGGVNTFSCYPRYGKLNSTVLAAANNFLGVNGSVAWTTGIDLATIVNLPTNEDFLANAQFGANFGDANELIAMIDLEPVSGAALGGTLKQQVNVLVQPYIGGTLGVYKQTKTVLGNASPFGAYFKSAAPNAPLGRATLFPVYWLNKIGFLSDKQADTFKSTVYGAQLASRVVLIVGTIVGGLMFFVALGFVLVKRRAGYNTQTSKSDLAL